MSPGDRDLFAEIRRAHYLREALIWLGFYSGIAVLLASLAWVLL